ncbi:MAG: T9SS type A sorting domain-containing protein, partial [Lentimicrobiaceae bacterium]|nr:T9SS type A sorting domain-containing protein [Lentimicrobiaceae bacterium]
NSSMRFISPQINTTGLTEIIISFKHFFDHASTNANPFKLSVETRKTTSSPWHEVWVESATNDIGPETVTIVVNNSDVGVSTFQFCIKVEGSSTAMALWAIDDIEVVVPLNLDVSLSSLNLPNLFTGNQSVSGKIVNLGKTVVNTANVSYEVDGNGTVRTTSLSGLNLKIGDAANYYFADSLIAEMGQHQIKVWVSDVNGSTTGDDNPDNDTLTRNYTVPEFIRYQRALYEEFTSSTCGPCANFNNSTMTPFANIHADEICLIKYQMSWPGSGDPYYTAEGGVRRGYYGVNAVPDLYANGKVCATNTAAMTQVLNTSAQTMVYLDIQSQHEISGNNVYIDCNIRSIYEYGNYTLHIVIIENETTGNVGSNGETKFQHVMMKMVPDANGKNIVIPANETLNFTHNVNMVGTHVEEMDDLSVVVFLQKYTTKDILTSNYSSETGSILKFYPQNGATDVSIFDSIVINFRQPVRNTNGSLLNSSNLQNVITFKENNSFGEDVEFTAEISSDNKVITIYPTEKLKSLQQYYVKIDELMNYAGVHTIATSTTFTTEYNNVGVEYKSIEVVEVYPNPASDRIIVKSKDMSEISKIQLVNTLGQVIKSIDNPNRNSDVVALDVTNVPSGVYVVKVVRNNRSLSSKVIIRH